MAGIAVWMAWMPAARAAATCSYDPVTATATVTVDGGTTDLTAVRSTGAIRVNAAACGAATVSNTDSIQVTGGALRDHLVVSGKFLPGLTPEADGSSEIEIDFDLAGENDSILFVGTIGADRVYFTSAGIDVGHDGDQDITTAGTDILEVDGWLGDDVIDASAYTGTPARGQMHLFGGDGNDRVLGDPTSNRIEGGPGDDVLYGNDGRDRLYGGPGNDTMYGGAGFDQLIADPVADGADVMRGGDGSDWVFYYDRTAPVSATIGNGQADDGEVGEGDEIGVDVENVEGGAGDDVLVGSSKANFLRGGAGADEVYGGGGDDQVEGGAGNDLVVGDAGDDYVAGDDGADVLIGGAGADQLLGGAGNDTIYNADAFADAVDCGPSLMDDAEPDPLDSFQGCEL